MKREEFLNTLFENIPDYTKEEREEIRQYYEELICDGVEAGLDEEEVISRLESPENIAFSLKKEYKEERKEEQEKVRELGGLCIIGTERHESRRIDNQLRDISQR